MIWLHSLYTSLLNIWFLTFRHILLATASHTSRHASEIICVELQYQGLQVNAEPFETSEKSCSGFRFGEMYFHVYGDTKN